MEPFLEALAVFDAGIAAGTAPDSPWRALEALANALVGTRLFTVMKVDHARNLSARVYSSDPEVYPVSGTKPINRTHWFDIIHTKRRLFVANTIEAIAAVFPDYETIRSLGCGSVINLPVFIADELAGTVNLLHEAHFYTPERVSAASLLSLPAKTAFLAAEHLSGAFMP